MPARKRKTDGNITDDDNSSSSSDSKRSKQTQYKPELKTEKEASVENIKVIRPEKSKVKNDPENDSEFIDELEQMRRIYSPNLPWHHNADIQEMYEEVQARLEQGELSKEVALMLIEILKDWWHEEGETGSPLNMQQLQHDFTVMFNNLQEEKLLNTNLEDSNKEHANMAIDKNKNKKGIYSYFHRCLVP